MFSIDSTRKIRTVRSDSLLSLVDMVKMSEL